MARDFSPMKGSFPDPNAIACKDCVYRDRTEITIGTDVIRAGITKSFCEKYQMPQSNGKPREVLFENAPCPEYMREV